MKFLKSRYRRASIGASVRAWISYLLIVSQLLQPLALAGDSIFGVQANPDLLVEELAHLREQKSVAFLALQNGLGSGSADSITESVTRQAKTLTNELDLLAYRAQQPVEAALAKKMEALGKTSLTDAERQAVFESLSPDEKRLHQLALEARKESQDTWNLLITPLTQAKELAHQLEDCSKNQKSMAGVSYDASPAFSAMASNLIEHCHPPTPDQAAMGPTPSSINTEFLGQLNQAFEDVRISRHGEAKRDAIDEAYLDNSGLYKSLGMEVANTTQTVLLNTYLEVMSKYEKRLPDSVDAALEEVANTTFVGDSARQRQAFLKFVKSNKAIRESVQQHIDEQRKLRPIADERKELFASANEILKGIFVNDQQWQDSNGALRASYSPLMTGDWATGKRTDDNNEDVVLGANGEVRWRRNRDPGLHRGLSSSALSATLPFERDFQSFALDGPNFLGINWGAQGANAFAVPVDNSNEPVPVSSGPSFLISRPEGGEILPAVVRRLGYRGKAWGWRGTRGAEAAYVDTVGVSRAVLDRVVTPVVRGTGARVFLDPSTDPSTKRELAVITSSGHRQQREAGLLFDDDTAVANFTAEQFVGRFKSKLEAEFGPGNPEKPVEIDPNRLKEVYTEVMREIPLYTRDGRPVTLRSLNVENQRERVSNIHDLQEQFPREVLAKDTERRAALLTHGQAQDVADSEFANGLKAYFESVQDALRRMENLKSDSDPASAIKNEIKANPMLIPLLAGKNPKFIPLVCAAIREMTKDLNAEEKRRKYLAIGSMILAGVLMVTPGGQGLGLAIATVAKIGLTAAVVVGARDSIRGIKRSEAQEKAYALYEKALGYDFRSQREAEKAAITSYKWDLALGVGLSALGPVASELKMMRSMGVIRYGASRIYTVGRMIAAPLSYGKNILKSFGGRLLFGWRPRVPALTEAAAETATKAERTRLAILEARRQALEAGNSSFWGRLGKPVKDRVEKMRELLGLGRSPIRGTAEEVRRQVAESADFSRRLTEDMAERWNSFTERGGRVSREDFVQRIGAQMHDDIWRPGFQARMKTKGLSPDEVRFKDVPDAVITANGGTPEAALKSLQKGGRYQNLRIENGRLQQNINVPSSDLLPEVNAMLNEQIAGAYFDIFHRAMSSGRKMTPAVVDEIAGEIHGVWVRENQWQLRDIFERYGVPQERRTVADMLRHDEWRGPGSKPMSEEDLVLLNQFRPYSEISASGKDYFRLLVANHMSAALAPGSTLYGSMLAQLYREGLQSERVAAGGLQAALEQAAWTESLFGMDRMRQNINRLARRAAYKKVLREFPSPAHQTWFQKVRHNILYNNDIGQWATGGIAKALDTVSARLGGPKIFASQPFTLAAIAAGLHFVADPLHEKYIKAPLRKNYGDKNAYHDVLEGDPRYLDIKKLQVDGSISYDEAIARTKAREEDRVRYFEVMEHLFDYSRQGPDAQSAVVEEMNAMINGLNGSAPVFLAPVLGLMNGDYRVNPNIRTNGNPPARLPDPVAFNLVRINYQMQLAQQGVDYWFIETGEGDRIIREDPVFAKFESDPLIGGLVHAWEDGKISSAEVKQATMKFMATKAYFEMLDSLKDYDHPEVVVDGKAVTFEHYRNQQIQKWKDDPRKVEFGNKGESDK